MTNQTNALQEDKRAKIELGNRKDRYAVVRELIFGSVYLGIAFLLGNCLLPFSTLPLGLALLCASSAHSWYILSGLLLSSITARDTHPIWITLTVYAICVLLRIGMLYFVDSPHANDDISPQNTYLARCWKSFKGLFAPRRAEFAKDDIHDDYYPGDVFAKDPPAERAEPESESTDSRPLLFCENIFLRMLTSVVCAFGWGATSLIRGGFQVYDMLGTLLMLFATPIAVFLLAPAFSLEGERLLFILPRQPHTQSNERIKHSTLSTLSVAFLLFITTYAARAFSISLGSPLLTLHPSTALAFLLTLLFSKRLGFVPGILSAVLSGLAASPNLTPVLILSSAIFTLAAPISKRLSPILAIASALVFAYFYGELEMLIFILPSALLTIPLLAACEKISQFLPAAEPTVEQMNDFTAAVTYEMRAAANRARLESLSSALNSLSCFFYSLSDQLKKPRREDVELLCREAFEAKCKSCPKRGRCSIMRDATAEILNTVSQSGKIDTSAVSGYSFEECGEFPVISDKICKGYATISQSTIKSEKTEVYAEDYAALCDLIQDISRSDLNEYKVNRDVADGIYDYLYGLGIDVRGVAVCGERILKVVVRGSRFERFSDKQKDICEQIELICGKKLSPPEFEREGDTVTMRMYAVASMETAYSGSSICAKCTDRYALAPSLTNEYERLEYSSPSDCGDHIAIFTTDSDSAYFYAIISDGMGSGKKASFTSGICTVFLEKMLCAGSGAESAIRMLNGVIRSKNQSTDDECSSTVDLFELDLINGHAVFAKSGAAPTYVVREGTVYKLCTRSVPLGILKDSTPRLLKFRMRPNDVIVMVSDGVTLGNDECPWLIDLLSDTLPTSMDSLRLDILRRAIASGSDDDLTAIAVRVKEVNDTKKKE